MGTTTEPLAGIEIRLIGANDDAPIVGAVGTTGADGVARITVATSSPAIAATKAVLVINGKEMMSSGMDLSVAGGGARRHRAVAVAGAARGDVRPRAPARPGAVRADGVPGPDVPLAAVPDRARRRRPQQHLRLPAHPVLVRHPLVRRGPAARGAGLVRGHELLVGAVPRGARRPADQAAEAAQGRDRRAAGSERRRGRARGGLPPPAPDPARRSQVPHGLLDADRGRGGRLGVRAADGRVAERDEDPPDPGHDRPAAARREGPDPDRVDRRAVVRDPGDPEGSRVRRWRSRSRGSRPRRPGRSGCRGSSACSCSR